MAKKKITKETKTRVSAKQKYQTLKTVAQEYIYKLKRPNTVNHLSITGYELKEGKKFSKSVPVPELITMVGMAEQFGKRVNVTVTGRGDDVTLNFNITDGIPDTPTELLNSY